MASKFENNKNEKLYRIIIDVQFGEMQTECDKLYDGTGYGTVFTLSLIHI